MGRLELVEGGEGDGMRGTCPVQPNVELDREGCQLERGGARRFEERGENWRTQFRSRKERPDKLCRRIGEFQVDGGDGKWMSTRPGR